MSPCNKQDLSTMLAQLLANAGKKLSKTEAKLKKSVAYKKACILQDIKNFFDPALLASYRGPWSCILLFYPTLLLPLFLIDFFLINTARKTANYSFQLH